MIYQEICCWQTGLCDATRADKWDLRCGECFGALGELQAEQLLQGADAQEVTLSDVATAAAKVKVCQPCQRHQLQPDSRIYDLKAGRGAKRTVVLRDSSSGKEKS